MSGYVRAHVSWAKLGNPTHARVHVLAPRSRLTRSVQNFFWQAARVVGATCFCVERRLGSLLWESFRGEILCAAARPAALTSLCESPTAWM